MMSNVLYTIVCLGTGAFFGAFAMIMFIIVFEDICAKKEKRDTGK